MTLSSIQQTEWRKKIATIKDHYPKLHIFYSTEEGWLYISYPTFHGTQRKQILHYYTLDYIHNLIQSIKHGK